MSLSAASVISVCLFCAIGCTNNSSQENNSSFDTTKNSYAEKISHWKKVVQATKLLVKNGDLITRAGSDVISASIRNFNKQDKSFSHSGLAFIEDGQVYVYHTIVGDSNPSGEMLREPFESFCKPEKKDGIGIFRYDLKDAEIHLLDSMILDFYKKKMVFDNIFDLKDDSKMYCAEIITKSLKKCTNSRIIIPTTVVKNFRSKDPAFSNKFYKQFEYIAVDNLYLNPFCKEVARVKFN